MRDSQTPRTPQGRVRIYERLGRAGGSPARTIGIAVVLLIIVVAIILALTRYTRRAGAQGADMTPPATVRVTGPADVRGTINTAEWPLDGSRAEVLVERERGAPVLVPLEALARQDDGTYRLTFDPAALEHPRGAGDERREPPLVVSVIQETLDVDTRPVETGRVRIRKKVHEREETVDPPLRHDDVVVDRVPVNRVVDGPIPVRSEGDTLIIPLFEEVLVVEKRLLLKEEVRITTHQVETHTPQRVTLRREEAVVERTNPERDESNPRV
jgi:uncharacterized protein (TIGR02271 family)